MNFHERIWELHKDWCYENPIILYGLIRSLKPQTVVEVGTYRGFSASWMAQALKENGSGHLYCIDNFVLMDAEARPQGQLEENFKAVGVYELITILRGDSDKVAWPGKVDFAYVDGCHSYPSAAHDFSQCAQRGAECICLDDIVKSDGPRMLARDIRETGEFDVIDVLRHCGMAICMRRRPKGITG